MKATKAISNILGTAAILFAGYVRIASMRDVHRYIKNQYHVGCVGPTLLSADVAVGVGCGEWSDQPQHRLGMINSKSKAADKSVRPT